MYGKDAMDAIDKGRDHRRDDIRWFPIASCPVNQVVFTKLHDDGGCRNIDTPMRRVLVRGQGFLANTMLMKNDEGARYIPTHWRPYEDAKPELDVTGPVCFLEFGHVGPCAGTPRGCGCPPSEVPTDDEIVSAMDDIAEAILGTIEGEARRARVVGVGEMIDALEIYANHAPAGTSPGDMARDLKRVLLQEV